MKWGYVGVEKVSLQLNACAKSVVFLGIVRRARELFSPYKAKVILLFEEINVEVTVILCLWWFWGEACVSPLRLPRGEICARCRSRIRHRIDIANFGGDIKLFLCVAYSMYLTHIQLGPLGLRRIDKGSNELDCVSHGAMLLLLLLLESRL